MNDAAMIRPLVQTLRATASELAELASIADHLELVTPAPSACDDASLVERHQLADLLTQRLAGLTAFLDALATSAPHGVALDIACALGGLKLSEQARRLAGLPPTAYAPIADPGELMLFGE